MKTLVGKLVDFVHDILLRAVKNVWNYLRRQTIKLDNNTQEFKLKYITMIWVEDMKSAF